MKNFLLGGLVVYLISYSIGCTYIISKGVVRSVRS